MLKFDPTTLYTKDDLKRELSGVMNIQLFLRRTTPAAIAKGVYWGAELIRALNEMDTTTTGGFDYSGDTSTRTGAAIVSTGEEDFSDLEGVTFLTRTRKGRKINGRIRQNIRQTTPENGFSNGVIIIENKS